MDQTDNELHKRVHELICLVFKSMIKRLTGDEKEK